MKEGKPFEISKHQVMEAYKRVKAKHGAGGTDGVDLTEFEKDLKKQPIQNMEQDVIRMLFPGRSQRSGNPEKGWQEKVARNPNNK